MNIEETMKKVDLLLQDRGLDGEYQEQAVRQLLYHLYVAIDIYRYMTVVEKTKAGYWYRVFKGSFSLRNFLKERKRNRERKNPPCTPLIKKDHLEKGQKTLSPVGREGDAFEKRKKEFWAELEQFIGKYDRETVLKFYYHWAEDLKGRKQMLWEAEKSWNTSYRLASWSKKSYDKDDKAAELRLERAKSGGKKTVAEAAAQQHVIAQEREAQAARREQEQAESKNGQMLTDEYLAQNPHGFLAKVAKERKAREEKRH